MYTSILNISPYLKVLSSQKFLFSWAGVPRSNMRLVTDRMKMNKWILGPENRNVVWIKLVHPRGMMVISSANEINFLFN